MCTVSVPKHPLHLLQDQSPPQNPMPWRLQMPMPYCWLHFSPAPALFGMMSMDGGLGPRSSFDYLLSICSSTLCHHLCLPRPPCKTCGSPLHPTSSHPISLHPTHRIHPILLHPVSMQPTSSHYPHPTPSHSTMPILSQTLIPSPQVQSVSTSSAQEQSHPSLARGRWGGSLEVSKGLEII